MRVSPKMWSTRFFDESGRGIFHRLQHFQVEAPCIHYFVFDLLISSGRDLSKLPLSERRKLLTALKLGAITCKRIGANPAAPELSAPIG
jgi:ATP-dependent DNA ligase